MTNRLAALGLLTIGALSLLCLTALIALGHQPPDVLPELATISVSALAGSLIPGAAAAAATSSPPPSSPSSPALAGLPIAGGQVAA
jgi:hypothetical protein